MRAPPRRSPSDTARASSGWRSTSGPPAPATRGWPACTARSSPSWTPTASRGTVGSDRSWATSTTRWWPPSHPASCRSPGAGRTDGPRSCRARRWTGAPWRGRSGPGSRIPFVPSAALLVRVDAASGPDLFDATLRGGEDVDLVWRLAEAGWDVRYEPASTVAHDGPASLWSFLARRAFYGTTAAPLARRHADALAPVHVSGWSLAVWTLAWARRPLLAQAVLAASVVILARRLRGLVRDPVAVAAHIAGGGTTRAALPALGSLARAWSPALVLGLAFRRTRRASALALAPPRAGRLGGRAGRRRPGARRGPARRRRRRLRRGRLGRLRPRADTRAPHPAHLVALAASGPPARCVTSCGRRRASRAEPGGRLERAASPWPTCV